jgi:DNA-binding transcriptional LysR family regulator
VAVPFARALGLRALPPPLPLPGATTKMIWHERMDADAGHAWLRGALAAVAAEV